MSHRISKERMHYLRNEVSVEKVLRALNIPIKHRDGKTRFLCPRCNDFHTAILYEKNLGCCFRCKINSNPIDFVISSRGYSFQQATRIVWRIHNGEVSACRNLADIKLIGFIKP